MSRFLVLFIASTIFISFPAHAEPVRFTRAASYEACFTPGEDCTGLIVAAIDNARSSIRVQAYSFTSTVILKALRRAHDRGVMVVAVLDRTNASKRYASAEYLSLAGIPVWIDAKVAIAHNKLIMIDPDGAMPVLLTGSFNFTKSAQSRNAENVLKISADGSIVAAYVANFEARKALSTPYQERDEKSAS